MNTDERRSRNSATILHELMRLFSARRQFIKANEESTKHGNISDGSLLKFSSFFFQDSIICLGKFAHNNNNGNSSAPSLKVTTKSGTPTVNKTKTHTPYVSLYQLSETTPGPGDTRRQKGPSLRTAGIRIPNASISAPLEPRQPGPIDGSN